MKISHLGVPVISLIMHVIHAHDMIEPCKCIECMGPALLSSSRSCEHMTFLHDMVVLVFSYLIASGVFQRQESYPNILYTPEVNTIDSLVIPHFISSSLQAYKIRCLETLKVVSPPSFQTPRAFFEHEHGMLTHSFLAIWLMPFQVTAAAIQVLHHRHHR